MHKPSLVLGLNYKLLIIVSNLYYKNFLKLGTRSISIYTCQGETNIKASTLFFGQLYYSLHEKNHNLMHNSIPLNWEHKCFEIMYNTSLL